MEARHLLITFFVDNAADSGPGSLRQAIEDANTAAGPDAIEFRLRDCAAKALITDKENLSKIWEIKEHLPALKLMIAIDTDKKEGVMDFWQSVKKGSPDFRPVKTKPDDPALIIYTSGTTGQPKGTLHGHRILLGILPGFEFYHNLFPREDDLMWTPLDWAYIGGSYDALFPTLHHGVPMLAYRPRKFDAEEAFFMMAKHEVRNLMAVPTVLRMMMHAVKHPRNHYDIRLRSITAGGETYKADAASVIPAQKAGAIEEKTGLTDDKGWCPIDGRTFESTMHKGVHVIGDASVASPLPKSGYAANSEAKVAAAAVVDLLNGREPDAWREACFAKSELRTRNSGRVICSPPRRSRGTP